MRNPYSAGDRAPNQTAIEALQPPNIGSCSSMLSPVWNFICNESKFATTFCVAVLPPQSRVVDTAICLRAGPIALGETRNSCLHGPAVNHVAHLNEVEHAVTCEDSYEQGSYLDIAVA